MLYLAVLEEVVVGIFVAEVVVKMIGEGRATWCYFNDSWNRFDFFIVIAGFIVPGNAVTALRLMRLLRVLKLVKALPNLQILVMGLMKSMSSIGYIAILLLLLFYLYAVLGVSFLGANDPHHMEFLHLGMMTLFRIATLEDWTDIMYIAYEGCDNYGYGGMEDLCVAPSAQPVVSIIYCLTFVVLSSMMILNLFIGVITSSMAEAKVELLAAKEENAKVTNETKLMEKEVNRLRNGLGKLASKIEAVADEERQRNLKLLTIIHEGDSRIFYVKAPEVAPEPPRPKRPKGGKLAMIRKQRADKVVPLNS
jgi:voltage-gated sodium channel